MQTNALYYADNLGILRDFIGCALGSHVKSLRFAIVLVAALAACGQNAIVRPLPTLAVDTGGCRGIGLFGMTLAGSPDDPRVAWLTSSDGTRQDVVWPHGYVAEFRPGLVVVNTASGAAVLRSGDAVPGACIANPNGDPSGLLLIRPNDLGSRSSDQP